MTTTTNEIPTLQQEEQQEDASSSPIRTFPFLLYEMLEDASTQNFEDIVSWLPSGNGFRVHNRVAFEGRIMGKYFENQTRYKSFLRQLNFYGFHRITRGAQKGSLFHDMFQRGSPSLCHEIKRETRKRSPASSRRAMTRTTTTTTPTMIPAEIHSYAVVGDATATAKKQTEDDMMMYRPKQDLSSFYSSAPRQLLGMTNQDSSSNTIISELLTAPLSSWWGHDEDEQDDHIAILGASSSSMMRCQEEQDAKEDNHCQQTSSSYRHHTIALATPPPGNGFFTAMRGTPSPTRARQVSVNSTDDLEPIQLNGDRGGRDEDIMSEIIATFCV